MMKEILEGYLRRTGFEAARPKAALIDMDGTLYDSMPHHADAWKRVADEEGIEADRDEFFLYEGRTGASTINLLFNRAFGRDATEEDVKRLYGRKCELFKAMPAVKAMPGAREMLEIFRHDGIKRVLVTGSGQSSLLSRLDEDYPGAFREELRITAANTKRGKPFPDPYLNAMEMAGAQPWESIAVENAPLGVESASKAGAFTIAVSTGPIPAQALKEAGADVVYGSMEECARRLQELILAMYGIW
ncbi:MAG: HAD hydrolase-like protein [Clostridium sp.]|nr:HAD hydrolase-like protein [Clostridium sp.]